MIKYNIYEFNVETKNGKNAVETFLKQVDQSTTLKASFENLDEATKFYKDLNIGVHKMSNYYLHQCKVLAVKEFDENGEEIGENWFDYASEEI